MEKFKATRRLVIEAGHRVLNHGGKCSSVHGHRYVIEAQVRGSLQLTGSAEGMVIDFGDIKQIMVDCIETPCDHAMIAWVKDEKLLRCYVDDADWKTLKNFETIVASYGSYSISQGLGKLYIIPEVPTAENLARHWYNRIKDRMIAKGISATLISVKVWETENCYAEYNGYTPENF